VEQFQGLIPRNYCSGVHKTGKSQSWTWIITVEREVTINAKILSMHHPRRQKINFESPKYIQYFSRILNFNTFFTLIHLLTFSILFFFFSIHNLHFLASQKVYKPQKKYKTRKKKEREKQKQKHKKEEWKTSEGPPPDLDS
jgi:hypothetical protein